MARAKEPAVYVLASKPNGVLYIGVTSDLIDRMAIHKQKLFDGFSKKYGVDRLVYYECTRPWTRQSCVRRALRNGSGPGRFGSSRR